MKIGMHRILVIDDDEVVRDVLKTFLKEVGFSVAVTGAGRSGIDMLKEENFDIVLTDLVMPEMNGIDVLKEIKAVKADLPVVVMTAFGTIQTAVEAMRLGAFDYVTKPFVMEELMIVIRRAVEVTKIQRENIRLKKQLKSHYKFKDLIGDSPTMQEVYDMIEKIADTDSTVLITGESGTGKELIAKTIHYNSSRSQHPFVPLNCAAIPKELIESELFGHEKGAFSGALNTRVGRFELAHNGTLFLDEIAELAPSLQVKLLRVLQEREFERVGGMKTIKVDVRILAATNRDLEAATNEGAFREDLYYRLNVIPIHIPPLRDRIVDIPLIADHFIIEFCKKRKRSPFVFSEEAAERLLGYDWPGNVRELKNVIERVAILVPGDTIYVSDLPDKFRKASDPVPRRKTGSAVQHNSAEKDTNIPDDGIDLNDLIGNMERDLICKALEKTEGVKSKAATLLGLNRTTLIEKMKKMGIKDFNK